MGTSEFRHERKVGECSIMEERGWLSLRRPSIWCRAWDASKVFGPRTSLNGSGGTVLDAAEPRGCFAILRNALWRTIGFLSATHWLQWQQFQVLVGCETALAEDVDERLGRPFSV